MDGKTLLTVQEAAHETGVSEATIRNLIQRGSLGVKRTGRNVYLDMGAIARLKTRKAAR